MDLGPFRFRRRRGTVVVLIGFAGIILLLAALIFDFLFRGGL
jgi:hypothetical protein